METSPLFRRTTTKCIRSFLYGCALLLGLEATAANFSVTTTLDTGPGSLRQIMTQANATPGSHQITFGVTGKITLVSGLPPVDVNLAFIGPGITNLTIAGSGTNTGSVFTFNSNSVSTLSGLTIASGSSSNNGGGVVNFGNLTVSQSLIASNNAAFNGGGVYNAGTLSIADSTVRANSTKAGFGGGICNDGVLQLTGCLIHSNIAYGGDPYGFFPGGGGGGGGFGGGLYTTNAASLINCTFSQNSAVGGNGGGVTQSGTGGGSHQETFGTGGNGAPGLSSFPISGGAGGFGAGGGGGSGGFGGPGTIAGGGGGGTGGYGGLGQAGGNGNTTNPGIGGAGGGGAGLGGGAFVRQGSCVLTNCTFTFNSVAGGTGGFSPNAAMPSAAAGQGVAGGIFNLAGTVVMRNILVAANTAATGSPDLLGSFASQDSNLIGNNQGASGLTVSDFQNVSGGLAPLANNGGPTLTHALLPGSLAIDGGRSPGAPGADQRGFARPVGSGVDIGAFEYLASTPVVGPTTAQTNVNGTVTFSVSVAGGGLTYQWQRNGTNVAGATSATFTVAGGTEANAGRYSVLVSSPTGPLVTSQPSVLRFFGDLRMFAGMSITGESGDRYRIEAADIVPGVTNWVTVTTFTHPGGTFLYTDPNSPGRPQRYYRAVLEP